MKRKLLGMSLLAALLLGTLTACGGGETTPGGTEASPAAPGGTEASPAAPGGDLGASPAASPAE